MFESLKIKRLELKVDALLREASKDPSSGVVARSEGELGVAYDIPRGINLTPCQGPIIDTNLCFFRIDFRPN